MVTFPSIFVSHGSPTLPLTPEVPAHAFLSNLGATLGRPAAILCISAHWETRDPAVSTAPKPETIHDFYGFPAPLYRIRHPAPGAVELAGQARRNIEDAGFACAEDPSRGLDHGAWVPLMLMYPEADVRTAQLSVQMPRGPQHHIALGRALAPLRQEGVLVIGSGGATHNLGEFRGQPADAPPAPHVVAFDAWLAQAAEAGDEATLVDYRRTAPEALRLHPREEHFLPFFVAFGAGGPGAKGRRLHQSFTHGVLSMAAFAFD
jgi:4,5-DOPA dioxygenase extradiol